LPSKRVLLGVDNSDVDFLRAGVDETLMDIEKKIFHTDAFEWVVTGRCSRCHESNDNLMGWVEQKRA
jgi:hypothetical protein